MRLVTEMHASLKQLAHRKIGKRHRILRFFPPRGMAIAVKAKPPESRSRLHARV
jgi:hypothetical protein